MNRLLAEQMRALADLAGGKPPPIDALLDLVSSQYDDFQSRAGQVDERLNRVEASLHRVMIDNGADPKGAERDQRDKERAQVTLESIGDGVVTTDENGIVEYLNPAAVALTGWTCREAAGQKVGTVLRFFSADDGVQLINPVKRCLKQRRVVTRGGQCILQRRDGESVAVQATAAPICCNGGQTGGAVMVIKDMSREMVLRQQLQYQACHDSLTGLVNRNEFELQVREALQSPTRGQPAHHALLYLDIDQFKVINDTCGHTVGDRLLKALSSALQRQVRVSDMLARLGGDEFGVLLRGCDAETAVRVAEEMRQTIRDFSFRWDDRVFRHTVSIGVVHIDAANDNCTAVLSAADVACFTAKDRGRNCVHVYDAGGVPERHQEMQWVSRVSRACEEGRLAVYCQPIVPLDNEAHSAKHFELLLRMVDRQGQVIQPNDFIPAAERYNLMPRIDRWVVKHALRELAHQRGSSAPAYTLSINLSGTSLSDASFLDFVRQELIGSALSDRAICFEITETAAIANIGDVAHFMFELKKLGCLFSLDDFGSGLSSFAYLKQLPVDFLKIDGQFVRNICSNSIDHTMVDAITQIGHAMGIETVAERVEDLDTAQRLAAIGVDYAQGFHYAKPDPVRSRDSFAAIGLNDSDMDDSLTAG